MPGGNLPLPEGRQTPSAADDAAGIVTALLVDEDAVDRRLVSSLLESRLRLHALCVAGSAEALALLERETPAVVLTDLQRGDGDGLGLIETICKKHPLVPVILLTAHGNEDVALEALRRGAASYISKRNLARDLIDTVERVLAAARVDRRRQRLLDSLTHAEFRFALENDPSLIPAVVHHFQEYLLRLGVVDATGKMRIGIALEEALLNGLYHGNLEITSELRQQDDGTFYRLAEERRRQAPYRDRRLHLHVTASHNEAVFVIGDEGPGFDPTSLPDPTDPANCGKLSGRGLLLIRTFMDEVRFNPAGTEITMIKRCAAEDACGS